MISSPRPTFVGDLAVPMGQTSFAFSPNQCDRRQTQYALFRILLASIKRFYICFLFILRPYTESTINKVCIKIHLPLMCPPWFEK